LLSFQNPDDEVEGFQIAISKVIIKYLIQRIFANLRKLRLVDKRLVLEGIQEFNSLNSQEIDLIFLNLVFLKNSR
jgi:hypothetical protein